MSLQEKTRKKHLPGNPKNGGQFATTQRPELGGQILADPTPDHYPPGWTVEMVRRHHGGVDESGRPFERALFQVDLDGTLRTGPTGRSELLLDDGRAFTLSPYMVDGTPNHFQQLEEWLKVEDDDEEFRGASTELLEGQDFRLPADDPVVVAGADYAVWPTLQRYYPQGRRFTVTGPDRVTIRVFAPMVVVVADGHDLATGDFEPPF